MNNLPPLSGAILITNPRKETMGIALSNPNDRRRGNAIARAVVAGKVASAEEGVALWNELKSTKKFREAVGMPRRAESGAFLNVMGKELPKTSKETRNALAKAKRAVAKAFAAADPEKYAARKLHPGAKKKTSYAGRLMAGKARRYLKKGKKTTATAFGGKKVTVVRAYGDDSVTAWTKSRGGRRAAGEWGHTLPPGVEEWLTSKNRYARGQGVAFPHKDAVRRAKSYKKPYASDVGPATGPKKTMTKAAAKKRYAQARSNGLALENPSFRGVTSYLTGYAVPVVVTGGAAGAVHSLAASYGVTERIASFAGKVPVVGTFVEDRLPFTLQGLLVGSALAAVAPMIGGTAGKYLALTGGAALVFGGGIDAFNFVTVRALESEASPTAGIESELGALALGGLALDNTSTLAGLALDNVGALGDLAMTNGSLDSDDLYGQASFADAYYCGADFSVEEGQALLNGKSSWTSIFGTPSVRMASRQAVGASHLAGKAGHRWGWLIRLVGFERACAICALPPKKRVALIAKLRQAAIAAFQKEQAKEEAHAAAPLSEDLPSAGSVAMGPEGATNYLGDPALFMGA